MTGGSLARRRPVSDIPCRSVDTVDEAPLPRRRLPLATRRSESARGLAHFARGASRRVLIKEPTVGCPGMPDVVSCVRNSMISDGPRAHLRWLCSMLPCPLHSGGDLRSRQRDRRFTRARLVPETPCEASYDEPKDTSNRRLQPTFTFSKTSTHVSCCYRSRWGGQASCAPVDRSILTVDRPASAGRSGFFSTAAFSSARRPVRPSL